VYVCVYVFLCLSNQSDVVHVCVCVRV
jgi:hypothetical protein